jgi:uncharacterized protein (TIGR01777 family)
MRILVTGASGLVGRATVQQLVVKGHHVLASSRAPDSHEWPEGVETHRYSPSEPFPEDLDAIINLAGASIGGKRWTRAYRDELVESRIQVTRDAVAAAPAALVQASAVGYYGMKPEGPCFEDRVAGDDFLALLCQKWEGEANQHKGRTVVFRFGHVLDNGTAGILGRLVPIYKMRLGGRIASGQQGLPWAHVDDVASALVWAAESTEVAGTYNLAAPDTATQSDLNRELARALHVKAPWWIPGIALRGAVGGLGPYLVGGQASPPDHLLEQGFKFKHGALGPALDDLFSNRAN